MSSIFNKIISREIPAHIIAENEYCLAFLDVSPLVKGHCLVIPKQEVDYIFDLESNLYFEVFAFSKLIAHAIQKAIPCKKVGIAVIGLEVPHAHIHLVPLNFVGDMNFANPKMKISDEELKEISLKIKEYL